MSTLQKQNLFLFLFILIALCYINPSLTAAIGVDPAWQESLIMVKDSKMLFGQDFVFTYGPLGFFNTRLFPRDFPLLLIVCIDLIYLLNLLCIIKFAFKQTKFWIVILFSLYLFLPYGLFSDVSFTYFYFIIFWILHAQKTKTKWGLWISLFMIGISFFIKVNLGIIVILIFEISLIYLVLTKAFKWSFFFLLNLSLFSFIFLLSKYLLVVIPNYLAYSIELIDGYQDAMSTIILSKKEFILIGFLEFVSFSLFARLFYLMRKSLVQMTLMWFLIGCLYFLNFKQAHTALSTLNLYGFFLLIPFQSVFIYIFSPNEYRHIIAKYVIVLIFFQTISVQFLRIIDKQYSYQEYLKSLPTLSFNPLNYIEKLSSYKYENNFKNSLNQLPPKIKSTIGKGSIDFLQSRLDYIYFNQLNYSPRPVIQSYSAYTPKLIHLNGEKFRSKSAPQFVLFQLDYFREQNPFWADSEVNLEILKRYELIDNFTVGKDSLLLFKQSKTIKNLNVQSMHVPIQLNKKIKIPMGQCIQFYGQINYSFWGKLLRFVFQPPYLYCKVTYENGSTKSFRVVNQILKGGILINKKVTNHRELFDYYSSAGAKNQNVSSLEFYSQLAWGFQK